MGIEIILEDEQGKAIESVVDPTNILHRILLAHNNKTFCYLNQIDWYGDTTFNRLQIASIREELARLKKDLTESNERVLLDRIDEFAVRCQSEPHLYVKFYGD